MKEKYSQIIWEKSDPNGDLGTAKANLLITLMDGGYVIKSKARGIIIDTSDDALALANAILDDMGLGWKPYPENKPEVSGWYLVQITDWSVPTINYWRKDERWKHDYNRIEAFRPLPAPYQPE